MYQILSTSYSVEVEFESTDTRGKVWVGFVYADVNKRIRLEQWEELYTKSRQWGYRWILRGDFNDIRVPEHKREVRIRYVASCKRFRELIVKMNMEEIAYQRKEWT